jgi:hypothetical protein
MHGLLGQAYCSNKKSCFAVELPPHWDYTIANTIKGVLDMMNQEKKMEIVPTGEVCSK